MKMVSVLMVVLIAAFLMAQTAAPGIGLTSASTASGCVAITGAAVTECGVTGDGLYIAVGTGVFAKVSTGGGTAGVTSFNGRTGAVTSANGDYSYTQISGMPPAGGVASVNGKTGVVVLTLQ